MANCSQCGFQLVPGKQFCGGCGSPTAPPPMPTRPLEVVETRAVAVGQPPDFNMIINQAVPAHPREHVPYADALTTANIACVGTVLALNLISAVLGQVLKDDAWEDDDFALGALIFD
eukprot:gene18371-33679_t